MSNDRFPHILLHGYTHAYRPRGRLKKKWIDNIREDCKAMDLTLHEVSRQVTVEKRCSHCGMLARGDYIIVAKALNHVKTKQVTDKTNIGCKIRTRSVDIHVSELEYVWSFIVDLLNFMASYEYRVFYARCSSCTRLVITIIMRVLSLCVCSDKSAIKRHGVKLRNWKKTMKAISARGAIVSK